MPSSAPGSDVRITGIGVVSALGPDVAAFAQALTDGKSGIRKSDKALPIGIAATIEDFSLLAALEAIRDVPEPLAKAALQAARRAPFPIQTSVVSALQAWQQAGLSDKPVAPERIAVVIAGHNTTSHYQFDLRPRFDSDPEYLSPRYALQFMDTDQVGVLSKVFAIRGEGFTAGGASASGNVGIIQGARLVQMGLADVCLVVGVVADLSPMEVQGFRNIGAMGGKAFADDPAAACRPFDSRHEGFIYGQASACLVLEAATSAERRGTPTLATYLGGAMNLHATAGAEPDVDGEARAMRNALAQSGLDVADVGYINTHGSSSPLGDDVEIEAIATVFGDRFPNVRLNATKGLTGHCLYSAGVVEAVATVVQMRNGFLHANRNLDDPINTHAGFIGASAVQEQVTVAMSNSFGFGGIDTCIVLGKDA